MDANERERARRVLRSLFQSRGLAVLATQDGGQPYTSLVAFASDDSLKTLVFVTDRNTRKHRNIMKDQRVSMMVHNSADPVDNFSEAVAVTAIGDASETSGPVLNDLKNLFILKHPALTNFAETPSSALVSVYVKSYIIVEKFEKVSTLEV